MSFLFKKINQVKTTLKGEEHFIVEEPLKMDLFGLVPNQQLPLPKVIENDFTESFIQKDGFIQENYGKSKSKFTIP